MRTWIKASVLFTIVGLTACSSSPTGRNQILMFSDQEMSSLGAQSFDQMKQEIPINKDKKVNAYVQCVAKQITNTIPPQAGFQNWEVVVFDSDQVNAFALPGGKIGVYTGLLKVAKNQDQLATVIGHEVAHVLADHSNERLSQGQLANAGLTLANVALGASEYKEYQQMTMAALGVGVQYGVILPYGRSQESEADIVGLGYMAEAGFNPSESVDLWRNMAAAGGGQPPEFFSTHPSHSTRIKDLQATIKTLPAAKVKAPRCG